MTFAEFLDGQGVSIEDAAARLRRDRTLIGRYRKREVTPGPEIIADIVEWSDGAVTPRELLAVPEAKASAA